MKLSFFSLVALTTLTAASPTRQGSLRLQLQNAGQYVQQVWHDVKSYAHDVEDTVRQQFDRLKDDWVRVFEHPAFPDHTMRYKHPNICDPGVKQISGYLDTDEDKHFFFWFFESRGNPEKDPVVLWLNGGPGCSSMLGLLMELGPCRVKVDASGLDYNPHSWNNNASIIFLDQPLNVGYSYGSSGATNSMAAAKDVYAFLQMFMKEFPQYADLDFHVAGESYGGHYVPSIGSVIHKHNAGEFSTSHLAANAHTLRPLNLKSLLIGNGLTDPLVQYKYYEQMGCNNTYRPIFSPSTCQRMHRNYPTCARLIESCYSSESRWTCIPASSYCNQQLIMPFQSTGLNIYDIRRKCGDNALCYDIIPAIEKYLNREDVKRAVGAKVDRYEGCNNQINFQFLMAGDWMLPFHKKLPPLLEDGVRVLIYAGDADYICNWYGNKAWTLELPWSGKEEFNAAKDTIWTNQADQTKAGELRTTADKRFAFLRVFEAGHMVPYDQPANSLDFFNRWLQREL
ncbi:uncharacterized protein VTP21DRAFT_668 [Calcarisporiella thermophila]|uniref:uncharacterized protein n=1 Tax=Calcarisporiella thermophila TaxID=911321 RepID=UPI0037427579